MSKAVAVPWILLLLLICHAATGHATARVTRPDIGCSSCCCRHGNLLLLLLLLVLMRGRARDHWRLPLLLLLLLDVGVACT
jgi:hypothetical protein